VIDAQSITGLILAGGQGMRMGQIDKGLVTLRGYPLVMHVLARLAPQVGPIIISANQNAAVYADLGHAVVPDRLGGFAGPLAGLEAGLLACRTPYLLTVPCDAPFLPRTLAQTLAAGLENAAADVAVAWAEGRAQPVFALMRSSLAAHLSAFLAAGGRKVDAWQATLRSVAVSCEDETGAFRNLNTRADVDAAE
jgi:molybdopterin-guanine dinucleotide biosynthesis protein A